MRINQRKNEITQKLQKTLAKRFRMCYTVI